MFKAVDKGLIDKHNSSLISELNHDFEYLSKKFQTQNVNIEEIKNKLKNFQVLSLHGELEQEVRALQGFLVLVNLKIFMKRLKIVPSSMIWLE